MAFTTSYLNSLEQSLINANSEEHAKSLVEGFSLAELREIQKHLKAYSGTAKTKASIITAIVQCTYTAVRTSKMIRRLEVK